MDLDTRKKTGGKEREKHKKEDFHFNSGDADV